MDPTLLTSLIVSCIAISVIFIVLMILIYTIKVLVHLVPYEEPPASKITTNPRPQTAITSATPPSIIAAITAAMAAHLGKSPQEFYITQINPK